MSASRSARGDSALQGTHPGQFVRESVLSAKGLSVVAAAKVVGVGRPALSNFLNGRSALTPEMASRLEVAFGIDAQQLVDMQAAYDAAHVQAKGAPTNAVPYVVPFLGIKARDIEDWVVRNISARTRLPVLLRTLVNSTGTCISRTDFPGNDDGERAGWDGYVDGTLGTAWIPAGTSGWEFGTDKDVAGKADADFAKSVRATNKAERGQMTFVFVTSRHWPGKNDWLKKNKAKAQWKDVRAYDSSDLEQWLEQSIPAQTWFANETSRASSGVRSLDKCWSDWAETTDPPLSQALFRPSIEGAKQIIASRLSEPPGDPIVIAADSVGEALAFLAQIFQSGNSAELGVFRDRTLVFDEPGVLPKLAQGNEQFIAVAANRKVERELGPLARSLHTIVIYPRNAANITPHVVLEPLNFEAFRSSLEEMGYSPDDINRYADESGRSLTVLRRRLSKIPAIRTPEWSADHETAVKLIPFLFVGAWNSQNSADQRVLNLFATTDAYENVEKECLRLVGLDDAPLWSLGSYRGAVSKLDLLFAIAHAITEQDLERYFIGAKLVLGEDDPALDLPENERWAAQIHGKSRTYSRALRDGISETLVLLAVHGNHLFQSRLGFDCELAVRRLVCALLTPFKTRILEANDQDLAAYAEAAPDEFLSLIEEDLKTQHPETFGLMRPADPGPFGGCPRSGLLWALEGLAWNPETLPRTVLILAKLAEIEINDNWSNKPINSLASVLCAWMPQTAADHDARVQVMKLLASRHPRIAWKICIEQFAPGPKMGHQSHKPRWRNDAYGFGAPVRMAGPVHAFLREMVEMALNWAGGYTQEMLCDFIQCLHGFSDVHQADVWKLVRTWAKGDVSDQDRSSVREKIRVTVLSRRAAKRAASTGFASLSAAAKVAYEALEPSDLLSKHAWLFRDTWIEESADELHEIDTDFRKRDERIAKLRTEALREILAARGLDGVFDLIEIGKAASQVGWLIVERGLLAGHDVHGFIFAAFAIESRSWSRSNLIAGALRALNEKERAHALDSLKARITEVEFAELLLLAPYRRNTWQAVDRLNAEARRRYWDEVVPDWIHDSTDESIESVERLLLARRPRAAFSSIHINFETIGPELVFRLLSEMLKEGNEKPGHYQLQEYYIERAFAQMNRSSMLSLDQKASLEFAYIDVLAKPWDRRESYGIPNLEQYVESHPELFVQAIVWTYRRKGGEDPPEWKVSAEQARTFAERGHKLLEALDRLPGDGEPEETQAQKLVAWISAVRSACTELGRLDVADICLGKFLSAARVGRDGIWPSEPVRRILEDLHSKNMMSGAHTGLYNSRGVKCGEGGDQERELAAKYRVWSNALQYSHPFLASELLMGMAKTYEHEANREDTEVGVRRRLR